MGRYGTSYILVALLQELGPVGDGGGEHARIDEVKLVVERPGILEVVNIECHVWWDAVTRSVMVMLRGRKWHTKTAELD